MITLQKAVDNLALALDGYVAADVAVHFSCVEVDALALVFILAGHLDAAETWVQAHADSPDEEEDDLHLNVNATEYVDQLFERTQ